MRRIHVGRKYMIAAVALVVLIGVFGATAGATWMSQLISPDHHNKTSHEAPPAVTHRQGQANAAAAAAVSPTAKPAGARAATPRATPAVTPTPPPPPALAALLPTDNDVPQGLAPSVDDKRDASQVAAQLTGGAIDAKSQAQAEQQLKAWGWSEAIERQYRPPQGQSASADGVRWLWVVIYRFGTPASASSAFGRLTAVAKSTNGLTETKTGQLGDQMLGLTRKGDDGLFHLWFRVGSDVVWIGGTSTKGMPTADIVATAQTIWARDATQESTTKPVATPTVGKSIVRVGDTATVSDGSNVRQAAGANATVVGSASPGDALVITGPSVVADGHAWWPVKLTASGQNGYIASGLVVPAGS